MKLLVGGIGTLSKGPANNFMFPERSWNHIPMLSER